MKFPLALLVCLFAIVAAAGAQPNVRVHYAQGQVWVVWDLQDAVLTNCLPTLTPALSNGVPTVVSNCLPATYAIYFSENPVTNTATATLVGRLFQPEWSGAILRDNVRASFGWEPTGFRIPDGAGAYRTLATNEGLFTHTVRSNFAGHYAVRPFGVSNVPPAWRASLGNAVFDLNDQPTCHLQASGTNQNYPVEWWTMWADGDVDLAAARPDFPIMENDRRRGIPHNFSVTSPTAGSLPASNVPACIAFHSGDGQAKMWLPDNPGFSSIGISPLGGLLVAVEDRLFSTKNGMVDAESMMSTGYVPTFDPFFDHQIGPVLRSPPGRLPSASEIIIPYPLRRLNWTLDWLYAHKNVDSNRVALVGHSGGAKGSLLWSHANPERFSAVGLYNPALGEFPITDARYIGTVAQNLPILLTNHSGQRVRALDIHQYAASYSPERDLPFTRIFHGKREQNWVIDSNHDARGDVEMAYREMDALGLGAATFWDLRAHGVDKWAYNELVHAVMNPNNCSTNPTVIVSASWSSNDLWVPFLNGQYRRDDATNQIRHRADRSYPALFNCSRRANHGDPGLVVYTNNTVVFDGLASYDGLVTTTECRPPSTGDKRGTWGGYFDWEPSIIDTETNWSAVLFLVGTNSAFNPVEICPDAARVADVAIRRPQQFRPAPGTMVVWQLRDAASNGLFQSGTNTAGLDGLVSIPELVIPRDPLRVRLIVATLPRPLGDFGDAPAPYPTTLTQSGALHTLPNTLFLGAAVDTEADGQADLDAQGDDNLGADDEDGVIPAGPLTAGQTTTINVTASGAGFLDGFLDTNADGDWADAGEQILISQPVVAGVNPVLFPVPGNSQVGQTFARFRLSTAGGLSATGTVADGEVEDYRMLIRAPASSNSYAGLRFSVEGSAQAAAATNGALLVLGTGAQPNSGVAFQLGRAEGFQSQVSLPQPAAGHGVLTRIIGRQDGQIRPLVSIISKWEGPDLDASKNEVSIESLEIAHEGLSVRHYDANGRQLGSVFHFASGSAAMQCLPYSPPPTGSVYRSGSIIILDNDGETEVARYNLRAVVFPYGIHSPHDPASGLPTGKVVMEDGSDNITLENYAFSVFSYEGLTQPVEALERVEVLGVGSTDAFAMSEIGLFRDGVRISGGSNTRLAGTLENSQPGFWSMPEVDDEVLLQFQDGGAPIGPDVEPPWAFNGLISEIAFPKLDGDKSNLSMTLETERWVSGTSSRFGLELSGEPGGYVLHPVFKGEVTGVEPVWVAELFQQGASVGTFVADDSFACKVSGDGQPLRVRPGMGRAGESRIRTGITFDTPMLFTVADQSVTADEFVLEADFRKCTYPMCGGVYFSQLRLRSSDQPEYRLTVSEPADWGDLPPPYMTTAAQNGARHRIIRGLRLGPTIDSEGNGRPSLNANGDDHFLGDDEDGVIFTSALVTGSNSTVRIAVQAPATGAFVDGFMDWNVDGDFEDPGEKILHRQPVVNGINSFAFAVPAAAVPGKTYARFRLSFAGGLDCEGPANSGEAEDYIVRTLSVAPSPHPSGLTVVPRGGATLDTRPDGGVEISEVATEGDDGVNLIAPSNVVSIAAGRIVLPLNPPIPLTAFASVTRPFADGLILQAHYMGANGSFWIPRLSFEGQGSTRPIVISAIFAGHYGEGQLGGRVRVCGFGASGYVGSAWADPGGIGSFSGSASIVRLGWATFPSSAWVVFDANVTFTGVDGVSLTGDRFRFLMMDDTSGVERVNLVFQGVSLSLGIGQETFGLSDLRVRNPMAPMIQTVEIHPDRSAMLGFSTEPDTFYSLEATDSLTSPSWTSPTEVYRFGSGGPGTLFAPGTGKTTRFFRLRLE
jgi:hypothetical protein